MANKSKGGGPKTDKGKEISSRNSITHGLTAKNWINDSEQELFDATLEALNYDFDPQSHIEEMLIAKLAECTVRLTRIQRVEDAMFDLASSEASHPNLSIKSLSNNNDELAQSVKDTSPLRLQFNADKFNESANLLNELKSQNFDDISNWNYVESDMPHTAKYIIHECLNSNIDLYSLISTKYRSDVIQINLIGVRADGKIEDEIKIEPTLSESKIKEKSENITSSDLHKYLDILSQNLVKELQVQAVLKDLNTRAQQVKNSAIPDPQKLSLVQRYRTADERQFSKTLGELLELQKRRNSI